MGAECHANCRRTRIAVHRRTDALLGKQIRAREFVVAVPFHHLYWDRIADPTRRPSCRDQSMRLSATGHSAIRERKSLIAREYATEKRRQIQRAVAALSPILLAIVPNVIKDAAIIVDKYTG